MFEDGRSKKVIFIAHCILNQNSISDGTAVFPAAFKDVIKILLDADIGIVQMPCPELCCLGLNRGNNDGADVPVVIENTRIRKEMQKAKSYKMLMAQVDYVMKQITEYNAYGFEIIGIIGANRSPNCGVETTSDFNKEISGKGIFMSELSNRIKAENLNIPMLGIKDTDNVFEQVNVLTAGGPLNKTTTIVHQIYTRGFTQFKMGYASAMSVVLLLIVSIITLVNFKYGNQGKDIDIG